MAKLDVKTSKLQFILVLLLGFFFVPMGSMILIDGLSKGRVLIPVTVGLMCLLCYAAVFYLVRRGHTKSVRYFTDEGLVRNDGTVYPWTDLSRVVTQLRFNPRFNTKGIWRVEIQFKDGGCAWVIPLKVNNFREVAEYVAKLPCEHTNIDV